MQAKLTASPRSDFWQKYDCLEIRYLPAASNFAAENVPAHRLGLECDRAVSDQRALSGILRAWIFGLGGTARPFAGTSKSRRNECRLEELGDLNGAVLAKFDSGSAAGYQRQVAERCGCINAVVHNQDAQLGRLFRSSHHKHRSKVSSSDNGVLES